MNLKEQKYILKIVDANSISQAARDLYISQSALSHYIMGVESSLSIKIFDRSTNPISLTPIGEKYVEIARQMVALENELDDFIRDYKETNLKTISIGIPHAQATYLLSKTLIKFNEKHPGAKVRIIEDNVTELESMLCRREIDLAVLPLPLQHDILSSESIYDESIVLITPKNYLSAKHIHTDGTPNWNEILKLPWAVMKNGHKLRAVYDSLCKEYNISEPNIIMESSSTRTVCSLVKDYHCVALMSDFAIEHAEIADDVDIYSLSHEKATWNIAVAYITGKKLTNIERDFINSMK